MRMDLVKTAQKFERLQGIGESKREWSGSDRVCFISCFVFPLCAFPFPVCALVSRFSSIDEFPSRNGWIWLGWFDGSCIQDGLRRKIFFRRFFSILWRIWRPCPFPFPLCDHRGHTIYPPLYGCRCDRFLEMRNIQVNEAVSTFNQHRDRNAAAQRGEL